jgi:pyridoxal phosphate enzyme (YggS family)
MDAGVSILGENYVQEARKKIEILGKDVPWHFIGHLQSNKAKYAVDLFDMIHSIDSFHLAERLNGEAQKKDRIMPVLIQVNISGEDTKHGIDSQKILKLIKDISTFQNLNIQGLMTMLPWSSDPEDSRPYFSSLRKLRDELESRGLKNVSLKELSMGMSSDFEVAIEEGATLIRIGTSIFGQRN